MGFARRIGVAVFVLIAGMAAQAGVRGLYINGQVHFFGTYSGVSHKVGTVDQYGIWHQVGDTQYATGVTYDDMYIDLLGQSTTVFNNKVYVFAQGYIYPADYHPRYQWVFCYDLGTNQFVTTNGYPKELGQVRDTGSGRWQSNGSAAVTFCPAGETQSKIYLFNDKYVWTSTDGINWSHSNALSDPTGQIKDVEPVDAIVFYPPDSDPMIMVTYLQMDTYSGYRTSGIYSAVWNGKSGSASTWATIHASNMIDIGGLFLGTAGPCTLRREDCSDTSSGPFTPGQKQTNIQFFTFAGGNVARYEYNYTTSGGAWNAHHDVWDRDNGNDEQFVFPWYELECSSGQDYQIQRQHLMVNDKYGKRSNGCSSDWHCADILSDAMVPINTDLGINCSAWGGQSSETDIGDKSTDPDAMTYRKYWSLLGVVLGTPPFATNGWESFELEPFSNMTFGSETSEQVSNSEERENSLMFSAGATVYGGPEKVIRVEDEMDLSYKYGWEFGHESSTTFTTGFELSLGTEHDVTEQPEEMGKWGWAIFHIPKMLVQDYAIYAYDFNVNGPHPPSDQNPNGTYLNQDLHSVQVLPDSSSVVPKAFELADPGGPNDDVPGLMSGMAKFKSSQDLDYWDDPGYVWESNASPWKVLLGKKTDTVTGEKLINTLTFTHGAGGSVYFSQDQENVTSTGYSQDIEISNSLTIERCTKLYGFKLNLKGGYEGHMSQKVTDTTSWQKSVRAELGMKPTDEPDGIASLNVQPYFLQATASNAPWVPTFYNSQLPWCITWSTQHEHNSGTTWGGAPAPASVSGTIVGGDGIPTESSDAAAASKSSTISIQGGVLAWLGGEGGIRPIPMTAGDFDPSLGATFKFNEYSFRTSSTQGKWTREGQTWKYKTKESVKPKVLLKLHFDTQTWDLDLSKVALGAYYRPSKADVRIGLEVNGRYSFSNAFEPEIRCQWDLDLPRVCPDKVELTGYSGEYDSAKAEGAITLKGRLPVRPESFGDMSFSVNGHQVDASLISLPHYHQALANGGELVYNSGGLHLLVDFGEGTWKANFKKDGFHPLHAPRWGHSRISIMVGGTTHYSEELDVVDHATKLSFKG